jgi:hypothetical protein
LQEQLIFLLVWRRVDILPCQVCDLWSYSIANHGTNRTNANAYFNANNITISGAHGHTNNRTLCSTHNLTNIRAHTGTHVWLHECARPTHVRWRKLQRPERAR